MLWTWCGPSQQPNAVETSCLVYIHIFGKKNCKKKIILLRLCVYILCIIYKASVRDSGRINEGDFCLDPLHKQQQLEGGWWLLARAYGKVVVYVDTNADGLLIVLFYHSLCSLSCWSEQCWSGFCVDTGLISGGWQKPLINSTLLCLINLSRTVSKYIINSAHDHRYMPMAYDLEWWSECFVFVKIYI